MGGKAWSFGVVWLPTIESVHPIIDKSNKPASLLPPDFFPKVGVILENSAPAPECPNIGRAKIKPFALLTLGLESLMPVVLYATWIICLD